MLILVFYDLVVMFMLLKLPERLFLPCLDACSLLPMMRYIEPTR